jgi:PAS domain S-box-containing protein
VCRESGEIERGSLAAAVEQAVDGVVITDLDGYIRYVNPAFTAMTGYSKEEAIGQHTRILKSGRQSAEFYQELWDTVRSERVWLGQMINRRKDGSFYHEEMRISPVRDSKGEPVSYIAIKHDVTEQRAAEEAQRFLAAIVENSEDAICALTAAGIILTWNRGAEAIYDYTAQEAISRHVSTMAAPEDLAGLQHFTEEVLQGKIVSQREGLGLRKDGRRFHLAVTGCPIRNPA